MITGKLGDLKKILDAEIIGEPAEEIAFNGLSIDSRTIEQGNLFVAIKGDYNDGHKYVEPAGKNGAALFLVEKNSTSDLPEKIKPRAVAVDDTKLALRRLALWWKHKFSPAIVALTGTNGKTTTKEIIADCLAVKYNVFRSPGNFNNLYGIPLSLAMLNDTHEICVLELGMSYPGEIATLTEMVDPDYALITNIGPAHLETMGSLENIAKAKFEILEHSSESTVTFFNLDNSFLKDRFEAEAREKVGFAVNSPAEIRPARFSSNSYGRVIFELSGESIHLQASGLHNLYNALAACAVAGRIGLSIAEIKPALEAYRGRSSRMEVVKLTNVTLIDDSYNANPTSMNYALKVLHDIDEGGRKIAFLGDMKELGRQELKLHEQVGRMVAENKPDVLITAGKLALKIANGAVACGYDDNKIESFATTDEAAKCLMETIMEGDIILVKASRAMRFDKVVADLKSRLIGEI